MKKTLTRIIYYHRVKTMNLLTFLGDTFIKQWPLNRVNHSHLGFSPLGDEAKLSILLTEHQNNQVVFTFDKILTDR
jgi:hypothetical protein